MVKRQCIKVISGNEFVIDKPVDDKLIVRLHKVKIGGKKEYNRLKKLIEGKTVDIKPIGY